MGERDPWKGPAAAAGLVLAILLAIVAIGTTVQDSKPMEASIDVTADEAAAEIVTADEAAAEIVTADEAAVQVVNALQVDVDGALSGTGVVGVVADDGLVTLTGEVDSEDARTAAENSVAVIADIAVVDNQVTVAAAEPEAEEAAPVTDRDHGDLGLITDGTLTVCTDVPYTPMAFEDTDAPGGYTGFDIELMRAIAADHGLELAVATPGWDAITSGLAMEAGDCDISAAAITITKAREENVDFSDSYFSAEESLMVLEDSDASTLADMAIVGVQSGTMGELYLYDNIDNGQAVSFSDNTDMYLALQAGDVEGLVADLVANLHYIDFHGGAKIIETYATDEVYGFAVKKDGSEDLLAAVNSSLTKLQSDGTYDEIFSFWFSG